MHDRLRYCSAKCLHEQGQQRNFIHQKDGSCLVNQTKQEAIYISDIINSGKRDTIWDSIHFHFDGVPDLDVYIWIFDDETQCTMWKKLSFDDRDYALQHIGKVEHQSDIILYDHIQEQHGQYLCFSVHVRPSLTGTIRFIGFEVTFPKLCFSAYLPPCYQNNPTLNRYLAIFKELYLELEEKIDEFYLELYPNTTQHIDELMQWLGISEYGLHQSTIKKREILLRYRTLRNCKGTAYYYAEMIFLLWNKRVAFDMEKDILIVSMDAYDVRIDTFLKRELPCYIKYQYKFMQIHTMEPKLNEIHLHKGVELI